MQHKCLKKKKNFKVKNVVQLMPNCPYRNFKDIKKFFNFFVKNRLDFLISCSSSPFLNPWWSFIYKNRKIKKLFPKAYKKRSQDLNEILMPSGAIWIAKKKRIRNQKNILYKKYKIFIP